MAVAIFATLPSVKLNPVEREVQATDEFGIDLAFTEPLFPPRSLSEFPAGGDSSEKCRVLFSDDSVFVDLGAGLSGENYYRFCGKLRNHPSILFDFESDAEGFRSFLNEASFVSAGLEKGMLSTGTDHAVAVFNGIGDVGKEVAVLIRDIALGSYKLALDPQYRAKFMNSMAEVLARLGRKIDELTWSSVWEVIRRLDPSQIDDAIQGIAHLYWEDKRELEAKEAGFGTESIRLGEATWQLLDSRTGARVAGSFAPDVAIITVSIALAPASGGSSLSLSSVGTFGRTIGTKVAGKVGRSEVLRLASPDDMAELTSLFAHSGTLSARARKALEVSHAASAAKSSRLLSLTSLVDPAKISTLASNRAMNARLKKLLYQLHSVEGAGVKPGDALGEVYRGLLGKPVPPGYFHSASLEGSNIEANYRLAREWGLFDSPENLDALRHGRSPKILNGPHAGELVDIDHRIPVKFAPELSNSPGNLILSPSSANRSRGAAIDHRMKSAVEAFEKETNWRAGPELRSMLLAP
ncbi:hypothetical protein OJ996_05410 [Luteolibacter sp. GHJ8]|uniref:A nuclease family of the HNH/ENDO VII superfamily with conserved AHH n=1 Tax=Luteolibacter rhizosphaerae TaxID=2989719 RepID=A0ABT3FZH5_9BACT|nr:hypothetical protein [Luteolibacter rhizosphaerae]